VVDVDSSTAKPDAHSFNKTDLIGGWERTANTDIPELTKLVPLLKVNLILKGDKWEH
jgi:hypothetical protein